MLTNANVDLNTAGKRVGKNNISLFSWQWAGDDELVLLIVTLIVDMTILSISSTIIANLPDAGRIIHELWGCLEDPKADGGLHVLNVTPIIVNITAPGWVMVTKF